eukprot:1377352-Amorphochlora_amoeboformis.AAC.1
MIGCDAGPGKVSMSVSPSSYATCTSHLPDRLTRGLQLEIRPGYHASWRPRMRMLREGRWSGGLGRSIMRLEGDG